MAYMDLIETQISLLLPQKGCSYNEANGPNRLHFLLKVVSAFEIHHYEHLLIANTIGNNLANFVVVLCTDSLFLGSYGNQADTVIHVYPKCMLCFCLANDHVHSTHSANYDKNYKLCFAVNKLVYLNSLCSIYSSRPDKTRQYFIWGLIPAGLQIISNCNLFCKVIHMQRTKQCKSQVSISKSQC